MVAQDAVVSSLNDSSQWENGMWFLTCQAANCAFSVLPPVSFDGNEEDEVSAYDDEKSQKLLSGSSSESASDDCCDGCVSSFHLMK